MKKNILIIILVAAVLFLTHYHLVDRNEIQDLLAFRITGARNPDFQSRLFIGWQWQTTEPFKVATDGYKFRIIFPGDYLCNADFSNQVAAEHAAAVLNGKVISEFSMDDKKDWENLWRVVEKTQNYDVKPQQ